jgi:hypothetical protein
VARSLRDDEVTANKIAQQYGLKVKSYRHALRKGLSWHRWGDSWTVRLGSEEHHAMEAVAKEMAERATLRARVRR